MAINYEIRQKVNAINKTWLETVFTCQSERVARYSLEEFSREHPNEYFELIKTSYTETCLVFTKET